MDQILGKKVLFLNPNNVMRGELVDVLISYEFEVALVEDHVHALRVIRKYPDSIIFINIDSGLSEPEWESYVAGILGNQETKGIGIGILSYEFVPEIVEKYLMKIGVGCGFVQLKLGLKECVTTILKALIANEARGRRRFVRAICTPADQGTLNFRYRGDYINGSLIDVSAGGVACSFDRDIDLPIGAPINDIQLKLGPTLSKVSGKLAGYQKEDKSRFVIVLDKNVSSRERHKIQQFVHRHIQREIDSV